MPRLHWFWRVVIATMAACEVLGFFIAFHDKALGWAMHKVNAFFNPGWGPETVAVPVVLGVPTVLIAFGVYAVLTKYLGPSTFGDNETRCRRCGYILRGITEPRCPECGERI